jgi:type II secretion system protein N
MLSEKIRRFGKAGMMAGFGFVIFAVVFYVTLPYVRFKDQIAGFVASAGYDMEAKQAGPSLGGGMTLKEVTLVSPATATSKATRILIDKATLSVSLLSRIFGTKAYGISAGVFGGDIDATFKTSKDASVEVRASAIDLAETPWVKNATNLPLAGKLDFTVDLDLPKQRPSEAKGTLSWACTSCALGDGKAKLIIPGNPLLAEGLGLPKIRLGDFAGKIVVDKGVGRLQNVLVKSQDIELSVEGEIHLAQPLAMSHVDLYIRFKLSDSLLRSSEKLRTIMDFTAQLGKRPDGFLGFRATGTFQNMSNVQWSKASPFSTPATQAPAKPAPPPHPVAVAPAPPPAAMPVPPPPPPVAAPAPAPPPPPPPAAPIIVPSAPTPAPMPTGPVAHGVGPSPPTLSPPTTEPAATSPPPAPPAPPTPPGAPAASTATSTAPAPATPPVPSTAPSPAPSSAPATGVPLGPAAVPPPIPPVHGGPPPAPPSGDEPR